MVASYNHQCLIVLAVPIIIIKFSGASWEIKHNGSNVIHKYLDQTVEIPTKLWKSKVLELVKVVSDFYEGVDKDVPEEDVKGYDLFWLERKNLKTSIMADI